VGILVDVDRLREVLDLDEAVVPDSQLEEVIAATEAALVPRLTGGGNHPPHQNCAEAALGMSVQVWQSRYAPGGQMLGADMAIMASPHLLGPGLVARFGGLLAPCLRFGGAGVA
jgi:hypothetical protein